MDFIDYFSNTCRIGSDNGNFDFKSMMSHGLIRGNEFKKISNFQIIPTEYCTI